MNRPDCLYLEVKRYNPVKERPKVIQFQFQCYALGMFPMLSITTLERWYVAFADDLTGAGTIKSLYSWWKKICEHGRSIDWFKDI